MGANELEGIPRIVTIFMIRRADPPEVTYLYAADTHKITVDEAA